MINHTLPGFALSATPGLNLLGLEYFFFRNCDGLGQWPKYISIAKIAGLILFVILFILQRQLLLAAADMRNGESARAVNAQSAKNVALAMGVLAIPMILASVLGLGASVAALTNSKYCSA